MIAKVKQDKIYTIELTEDELKKIQHIVERYDFTFVNSLYKDLIDDILSIAN